MDTAYGTAGDGYVEHQNGWGQPHSQIAQQQAGSGSFASALGSGSGGGGQPMQQEVWPSPGQDQEEAELAAALEASLRDQAMLEESRAASVAAAAAEWSSYSAMRSPSDAAAAAGSTAESSLATPGLANELGEYNCFLNVVIQCLWHCSEFRAAVMAWSPEIYQADPVVHALRNLFTALAETQTTNEGGNESIITAATAGPNAANTPTATPNASSISTRSGSTVVNPAELREALAAVDARFATRQMADAAELLEQIFEQVAVACATAGVPSAVDSVFGICVTEEVTCSVCNHTTHHRRFIQHWLTAAATALRMMAHEPSTPGLGAVLRLLQDQERKTCDKEEGGCSAWNPVNHFLDVENPPGVFTLQLAWESHAEHAEDIAGTLSTLTERIDLSDVYQAVDKGVLQYRLRALVAYYGQHYQAFVQPPKSESAYESSSGSVHGDDTDGGDHWIMVDDARAVDVGDWSKVVKKCQAGKIQPSVLFFERVR